MTPVVLFGSLALLTAQATPAAAPVAASAPVAADSDPQTVADNLAEMYDKSCGGRLYGMYAEACNGLAAQLRRAQEAARKAHRTNTTRP